MNRLSDTQPSPGWGFICANCKHAFSDAEKYVDFPPSLPCDRLKYTASAPIFELKRFADGSEACTSFEVNP